MTDPTATPAPTTDNFRLPTPTNATVLEQVGSTVTLTGVIEGFYDGDGSGAPGAAGAVVRYPSTNGGSIGVASGIQGGKVGDPVKIVATVLEATLAYLRVKFPTVDKSGQEVSIPRDRLGGLKA